MTLIVTFYISPNLIDTTVQKSGVSKKLVFVFSMDAAYQK